MDSKSLGVYGMVKLINKNNKKREEEISIKAHILAEKIKEQIPLNSYFMKNTTVNVLAHVIVICLKDVNVSGIAKTQDDEIISYRRYKNSIKFHINKSSYTLFIIEDT